MAAERERMLLSHYKLSTLYPTEWPQEKDDDDASDTESVPTNRTSTKPRFTVLEQAPGLRGGVPGSQRGKDRTENMVQKDEADPLGTSDSVVDVLQHRGLLVEEDLGLRNQFLLSSTTFSPTRYLSEVHSDASVDDLLRGLDFLSRSIEKKSASLKVLVESNFERFVRAKATIDNVYKEMREHGNEPGAERRPHSRQTSRNYGQPHFRSASGTLSPTAANFRSSVNEKRKNALIKETEYGVQGIKVPLLDATVKAEEVWGPALGGREREENLKSVVTSIEKNRNIFDTGISIEDCIKRRDYETLATEYARAQKYAQEAKSMADRAKQNQLRLNDDHVHQIVITSRVWMDIQSRLDEFRRDVWSRLTTSHVGAMNDQKEDGYMELIAVLLQVGVQDNPISAWLHSRSEYLRNKIITTFERSRVEIEISRRRLANGQKPSSRVLASHLKTAGKMVRNDDFSGLDTPQVLRLWDKVDSSLSALLSADGGLLGEVLEFWDTAQAFIDGKKQKSLPIGVDGSSRKHHALLSDDVRALRAAPMSLFGLIKDQVSSLFIESPIEDISQLFTPVPPTPETPKSAALTPSKSKFNFKAEDIPPPSPKTGEAWEKHAFWPPYSNSLSASIFLGRVLSAIAVAAGEIVSLNIVKQDSNLTSQFKALVNDVRERSVTVICAAWLNDSENCKDLEDWCRSTERKDITNLPSNFSAFETSMLTNIQKIVYVTEAANTPGLSIVVQPPPQRHVETVQKTFRNSLYKAFSGMIEHTGKPVQVNGEGVQRESDASFAVLKDSSSQPIGDKVDANNKNVRKLITMSNFQVLRNETVPAIVSLFETHFSSTISDDSKTARDVLAQMNSRVFKAYVKPTVESLESTISAGITDPSYATAAGDASAASNARPTDAKPYVYEVLLTLVVVHTEVSRTAPSLTPQIISYLLESISTSLIDGFKKKPGNYSLTALMQATLDVEFLAQTLAKYTTEKASDVQGKIYLALDERTDNDARLNLQKELPEMRSILKRLRENTKGEFACFRRDRSTREKSKA